MKSKYLNALSNASQSARQWLLIAAVLVLVLAWQQINMTNLMSELPVRMIPHEHSMLDGPVTVTADMDTQQDEQYLTLIALTDVQLYTNWTSRNVESQFGRLQNRLSPELYAEISDTLATTAERIGRDSRSQLLVVRPDEGTSIDGRTVRIQGVLRQFDGSEMVEQEPVTYRITYQENLGVPLIHALEEDN